MTVWTDEMKSAAMADAATVCEQAARIAELEADLADTLRAVLHHFGPGGAHKVTSTVLELQSKRKGRRA